MPRTNPLSRRLARLHHPRQRALLARVDAGATAIDRAIGGLWQQLLQVIRTTHGYTRDYMRALAILNQLPVIVSGTLAQRLRTVYHQAHRGAGLSVVEVLPHDRMGQGSGFLEGNGDWDTEYGFHVRAGRSSGAADYLSRALLEEELETPTEPTVADLLLGPPPEEWITRALAPFVRLADWIPIGNESRRLPQDLAGVVAGGMSQGQSQRDIAKAIRPYLDGSRMRARRAARTFGMVVGHDAQTTAWEQSGLVMGYTVHATKDIHTRPAHYRRDGNSYWKRPGPGQIGMESMPHPPREADGSLAWNCRCFVTPILVPP